ncbi:unnamed protein product [Diplocarpon coronariae]
MATFGTADAIHSIRLNDGTSTASAGGVYPIRTNAKPPSLDIRSPSFRSIEKRGVKINDRQPVINDEGLRRDGDFKKKQVFTGKTLFWLAYQSTGVRDILEAPLYVYSSTFSSEPSYQDLVGVLSAVVIWSLTLMVTVKYVLIILYADDEGEGGTFSTYSLLSRFVSRIPIPQHLLYWLIQLKANITQWDPREASLIKMERYVTGDIEGANLRIRSRIENSKLARGLLKSIGVLAVSMVMADGVLTPAQSVLGAVQGLSVVKPDIDKSTIVGTTCGILLLLNKTEGWRQLGGTLLAFTGVEALFADLGAFSRKAIQISWLGAYSNPFYNAVPPGMLYPSLVIAILAAIVASQAIITATFQLLSQVMKLSYFPQIKVVHTSKVFHGQDLILCLVYVPLINWLLMLGTVLAAAVYNNVMCVMFVTFFDSCMVSLVALIIWRLPYYVVFFPWLIFACLDGVYLSAALVKVPDGAWFTLLLSGVIACLLILWRFGKEQQWQAEAEDRFPATHLVEKGEDGAIKLTQIYGGDNLSTIKGFGIFFDKAGETTPLVFTQFLSKLVAAPEIMVFFHLRPLETPSVIPENRYTVTRVAIPNCYRLVVRHGYMDEVITPDLASLVCAQIHNFIVCQGAALKANDSSEPSTTQEYAFAPLFRNDEKSFPDPESISLRTEESVAADLAKLQHAFDRQVLYIIGKGQMRVRNGTSMGRRMLLNLFLWLRDNTRTKIANLRVQPGRVIELGFVKDV